MVLSDNIVGTRIGIYDVLYECEEKTKYGNKLYRVQCIECHREFSMQKYHIGRAKSCKHIGLGGNHILTTNDFIWKNQRLKKIFMGIKRRCYNSNSKDYRWYGAKGVKICDEWLKNPKSFEDWALSHGYNDYMTIDRINENKNYAPDNCRWISGNDNAKYKSTTRIVDVDGECHTGREWAGILNIGTNQINKYIRKYGLENTVEFIRRYKANPTLKPKHKQSYYDLYMAIQN